MTASSTVTLDSGSALQRFAQRAPLLLFFSLAYVLGWIAFLPLVLRVVGEESGLSFTVVIILGTSTPTIAALCTQWLMDRSFRICRVYSSARSLLPGLLVGIGLVAAAFVFLPAIVLVKASPAALHWSALRNLGLYWSSWSTFLGGPFTEEPGWRGFALPRLQTRFGPALGSILLGVLWAGWHAPLLVTHTYSVPVWGFAIIEISVSILMTCGANLSRASILVPILMHAAFNASSRTMSALSEGIPTREPMLVYYLFASGAVAFLAIVLTRGRLFRREKQKDPAPTRGRHCDGA